MAENPGLIRGKAVLVIEDGPTLTHGGMSSGAGTQAAKIFGAAKIVDPKPFAVGSIKEALVRYSHIGNALPAMGYYPEQIQDLEESVNRVECDLVIIATPVDLRRLMDIKKPSCHVTYELEDLGAPRLRDEIRRFIAHQRESKRLAARNSRPSDIGGPALG